MDEAPKRPRVVVAQKGSREHFLAARALHRRGQLAQLIVDWYVPARWHAAARHRRLPARALARALGAGCAELPDTQVRSLGLFGLGRRLIERFDRRADVARFMRTDAAFARRVAALTLPPHEAFFGYAYASLEILEAEKRRGHRTVLGQIDPGAAEFRLVAEEARRWPLYADPPAPLPEPYYARNRREWALADVIAVNSDWSRELLLADGAPAAKVTVLPLAYEAPVSPAARPPPESPLPEGPLRVLWLGTVNLRKGFPYLVEAARRLEGEPVIFDIVGPVEIRPAAVDAAPANLRWHGPLPRSRAAAMFAAAQVFVLPTISDGFGIAQLEALAHGLPVIVSPNCARIVADGVTGHIIPPRDADALAEAILSFIKDPARAAAMAPACRRAAAAFTLDAYGAQLAECLTPPATGAAS